MIIFELRTESSHQRTQRPDVSFQYIITESDASVSVTPRHKPKAAGKYTSWPQLCLFAPCCPSSGTCPSVEKQFISKKPIGWRPERSNGRTTPTQWIRWAGGECGEGEGSVRKGSWQQRKWKKDLNFDGFDMIGCFKLANLDGTKVFVYETFGGRLKMFIMG